ncbi:RNA polymerase II elongation factor Ell isoform X2 [Culicoides brevitarsis]|uniref:RNA polymerase II elongation factor Ell isoform X2 n=1 Tax=Culicoides brevitarsis TaxID=469753 RepID=UPI00307B25DD
MATLHTGTSYELSQGSPVINENKEFIYVKLTDSALRAIEEYQRNPSKQGPSIQFLGNEGYLTFPSANGEQKFSFQINESKDQGPQGSLECVQQNSQRTLETLGTLPYRMRIQANDDVYETTRHKMAKETENIKTKCTREIKPNEKDIGRKVKLKPQFNRVSNIPSNSIQQHSSSPLISHNNSNVPSASAIAVTTTTHSNNSYLSSSLTSASCNNSNSQATQLSNGSANVVAANAAATTTNSSLSSNLHHSNLNSSNLSSISSGNNGLVPNRITTASNNHNSNNNRSSSQRQGNTAIMKRSIKERLIHLLALRPYKKPELYLKLQNDGIKDKEKHCIATVLKQISFMRDNTYHLHRHIWNDVQEDWPFYEEQDRQTLKRRKPQNLTPPLSSDGGSSTSGQSPTSTHNGSPPPAVKRPPLKSDTCHLDGPASKKQRISHYRKDIVNQDKIRSNVTPNAQESEDSGLSLSYSVLGHEVANRISSSNSVVNGTGMHDDHRNGDYGMDTDNNAYRDNANDTNDFSNYTKITSVEQRRRYKTEFANDYQEYKILHGKIRNVTSRFAQLENELRNVEHDDRRVREIEKQIYREYEENKRDRMYQQQQQRFNYLHEKLSHIKKLVADYDCSVQNGGQESY